MLAKSFRLQNGAFASPYRQPGGRPPLGRFPLEIACRVNAGDRAAAYGLDSARVREAAVSSSQLAERFPSRNINREF